ncbi:MAG: PhnD/SsuA/transferrin family substrate-binding protein [gamma proteobacterium symbiont of Taylorina sp.]|nr:PhnD/SsuA/transferrin family substrate-binding protein [gamma proteobacterium symbiont of Taylorina sp.]
MKNRLLKACLIFLCWQGFIPLQVYSAQIEKAQIETVKIGVLAKRGVEKSLLKWEPTAEFLNQRFTDAQFQIVPMKFDEIPILVKNKLVDFVIVNSAIYVDLYIKYGVRRILTLNNHLSHGMDLTQFGSVIFTRTDSSELNDILDLKNQSIAAVHPTSLGGWLMAYRELKQHAINKNDLKQVDYLQTHDAVVHAVLNKKVNAGIVRTDTLERMQSENKLDINELKIINAQNFEDFPFHISTRLYPEWPIAKLKHTPGELAKRVSLELMHLKADDTAAIAAKIKGWMIPENYLPVHELLKELEVGSYRDINKISFVKVIKTYRYLIIAIVLVMVMLLVMALRILRLNQQLKIKQKSLEFSQENLKATFEQAAVGLMHLSPEGELLRVNQRFCVLVGYTQWELKNINLMDISYSEDLAKEIEQFDKLRQAEADNFSIQKRFVHKDTTIFWTILTVSCIRDENEHIKYMVAVVDDISKLKALEADLKTNKKQQELILHLAGDGILGLDINANHTFVNQTAADMLGYTQQEMLGINSHQMWHHTKQDGKSFPDKDCPIASVLKQGVTHRGVHELFWRKDGSSFYADYISTPIIESDVITGAVVLFHKLDDIQISLSAE